jgi:hypothetical protein
MPRLGHEDDDQDQNPAALEGDAEARQNDPDAPEETTEESQPVDGVLVVEEDARLNADQTADDEDAGQDDHRNRKRETARERRERARLAKERDKLEIDLLRRTTAKQDARLQELERSLTVTKVTDLDSRLANEINTADQMDKVFAAAITAKNGEDARRAAQLRDEAKQRAWQLYNEKQGIIQHAQQREQTPTTVPYQDKALNFLRDKQWYNPQAGDEDSLVVEALDKALSKQMNPNDPNYWDTLDKKVRARLPHRFQTQQGDDADDGEDGDDPAPRQQARRGPPTGGSSRDRQGGVQQIRLPAQMVEAMKEAGHWDDPKVRARVAQRYINGLKNNRG